MKAIFLLFYSFTVLFAAKLIDSTIFKQFRCLNVSTTFLFKVNLQKSFLFFLWVLTCFNVGDNGVKISTYKRHSNRFIVITLFLLGYALTTTSTH